MNYHGTIASGCHDFENREPDTKLKNSLRQTFSMSKKKCQVSSMETPISVLPLDILSGNKRRWMLFVDGENFSQRGQEFARQNDLTLEEGRYYSADTFLWLPNWSARSCLVPTMSPISIEPSALRAYYYTSVVGDDNRLSIVRRSLWELGFQPEVFKKDRRQVKSKGVDIALATDFLSNAFLNNYDVAVLVAGDAEYIPMLPRLSVWVS